MTKKLETLVEHQKRTKKQWPDALKCASSNVRIELKNAFPSVKFSVRISRFTGGDDLRVEWTDGPTVKQVKEIVGKYAAGSFDPMTDYYDYDSSDFNATYGDAKYIFTTRNHSREALQKVADDVAADWKVPMPEVKISEYDGNVYIEDEGVNVSSGDNTWDHHWMARQVIYRTIQELAF